ncbi:TIM barrel protein [Octadecabacter sp.]|nr:TIM barrel protein [Octadecabacter sp.]
MPKFCANLSVLFTELPLLERPLAAKLEGFDAVEVLFPYDENAAELGTALARSGLPLALINCPPPNYADPDGPRGFAAVPDQKDRFQQAFRRSVRYAGALGAEFLHVMAGTAQGAMAKQVFVENLKWAAEFAPSQKITIEPINAHDMPGYFLDDFDLAMEVLVDVDAPNVHLQFDAYHAAKITGDVLATWEKVRNHVAHIQVGSVPDRHEPDDGGFNYPGFFQLLDKQKFEGWVSGEYHPKGRTEENLSWMR